MNTVTLSSEAYQKAVLSAKQQQLSVDELVNRAVLNIIVPSPTQSCSSNINFEDTVPYDWDDLCGIFASDKSDKEVVDQYLQEKYGL